MAKTATMQNNKRVHPNASELTGRNRIVYGFAGLIFSAGISLGVLIFHHQLAQLNKLGIAGIFLLSLIGNSTVIFPVPSFLAAILGGTLYQPILVGIVSAAGATIGEMTGYIAGRSGRTMIYDRSKVDRFKFFVNKYGLLTLFVLAALPNPLFDLAGIAAGMLGIPVWKYLVITFAGKSLKFLSLAYFGAGLGIIVP